MQTAQQHGVVVNLPSRGGQKEKPSDFGTLIRSPYELCAFLRDKIAASKMLQKDIAKRAGLCPQTVSRMASGETKDPRLNTAVALLLALNGGIYVY